MWITTHEGRTVNMAAFHELRVSRAADGFVVQVYFCPGTDRQYVVDLTKPLEETEANEVRRRVMEGKGRLDFSRSPQPWFIV